MDDAPQPLRETPDRRRADDWALALASAGIDCRLDAIRGGYALFVPQQDRLRADAILDAFDDENRPRPAVVDANDPVVTWTALIVAGLLCVFFVVSGAREAGSAWFDRGAAVAWRINEGQLWRCVTALTLHADVMHIATNAVTLAIFGSGLCSRVGSGVAIWLMLLSGALGNWLTAALRGTSFSSVGASTAIFGALGALAAVQAMRRRRGVPLPAWRAWAPVAAGLGLLGFLGTSERADVLAHVFGFAVGAGLGLFAGPAERYRDRRGLQTILAIGAAAVVALAWAIALR
jgi:membrane associated rhomboid family serine protease